MLNWPNQIVVFHLVANQKVICLTALLLIGDVCLGHSDVSIEMSLDPVEVATQNDLCGKV